VWHNRQHIEGRNMLTCLVVLVSPISTSTAKAHCPAARSSHLHTILRPCLSSHAGTNMMILLLLLLLHNRAQIHPSERASERENNQQLQLKSSQNLARARDPFIPSVIPDLHRTCFSQRPTRTSIDRKASCSQSQLTHALFP
jgi:hypothetical protein